MFLRKKGKNERVISPLGTGVEFHFAQMGFAKRGCKNLAKNLLLTTKFLTKVLINLQESAEKTILQYKMYGNNIVNIP